MGKMMVKKMRWFFAIFAILALISGCETVDAIRTGDIKMRDIGHMIELGITGDIEKENTIWETAKGAGTAIAKGAGTALMRADKWMQKNLW